MTPEDKTKLRDAFQQALKVAPSVDLPLPGMTFDGKPATKRMMIEHSLTKDSFYSAVDEILSRNNITLDKYIEVTTAEMKKPRI